MIARMSTRLVRKISVYAFPFLLVCMPALPWGTHGHQIVAEIAARKLKPQAQTNIVALLRSDPNDDLKLKAILGKSGPPPAGALEKALKTIATWPDEMPPPKRKGPTAPWHFIDIGLFEGPSHISERCPGGDNCVTQKIGQLVENLKTSKDLTVLDEKGQTFAVFTPPKELRFLVHFLGDIHQPLHCVTNADAGGNCIKETGYTLKFPELHAVWDDALVDANISNAVPDTPGAIIKEFDGNLTVPTKAPNDIAAESFALAKHAYEQAIPPIPVIDHFVDVTPSTCATKAPPEINKIVVKAKKSYGNPETLKVVRTQLYKGGVRLAVILNSIYDHP
jgi:nuclease S1